MKNLWILSACFAVLMAAPMVFAAGYYVLRKSRVLSIRQDKIRDPRFFGKSFSELVKSHLDTASDGVIRLSREERFLDADKVTEYAEKIQELVIARSYVFCPPQSVRSFEKEIYCAQNALLFHPETELRALYCDKKAILGKGITVYRWVDAGDTLAVYDGCDLGISASAANAMSIGYGCTFRRLYAPVLRIAQHPQSRVVPQASVNPRIYYLPVQMEKENNVRYLTNDLVDENGIINFSVVSPYRVTVAEGLIVQGDIRSHQQVRLCDDTAVCGNIFAEKDVWVGRNATVLGSVFSQGSIYFEAGASVGQRGKISSVIARENITFERNNFVFGYVCCEQEGKTLELPEEEVGATAPEYHTLDTPQGMRHLSFKSLHDFEHVDWQGYRREPDLEDVVFPPGAARIQRSMFFNCPVLRRAPLPVTVQVIEDYAFADCFDLKEIGDLGSLPLTRIGISAFENCALEQVRFPGTLRSIGGAAFAGCRALRQVEFPAASTLRSIGDHSFRGCTFSELWLPDTLEVVGVSAFSNCAELRHVSVPEACAEQPGVRELIERGVQVELRPLPPEEPEKEEETPGEASVKSQTV